MPRWSRVGLPTRATRVMKGSTTKPVRRSSTTEANDSGRWPLPADSRVTRRTSPPTVLGRKLDTNCPARTWTSRVCRSEGRSRARSTRCQRRVARTTAAEGDGDARRSPTTSSTARRMGLSTDRSKRVRRKPSMVDAGHHPQAEEDPGPPDGSPCDRRCRARASADRGDRGPTSGSAATGRRTRRRAPKPLPDRPLTPQAYALDRSNVPDLAPRASGGRLARPTPVPWPPCRPTRPAPIRCSTRPSSSGSWGWPCAPAATSPRCSPRTGGRRPPASTTARSRSSPRAASRGAGIRVVRGDTTGFAHTSDLTEAGLRAAAEAASAAARGGGGRRPGGGAHPLGARPRARPTPRSCPRTSPRPARSSCCCRPTTRPGPRAAAIRQVGVSYADSRRRILVANSDGLLAGDDQVRTRFMVSCVAAGDTGMQTGYEGPGGTVGFEFYDERRRGRGGPHRRPPGPRHAQGPARAQRPAAGRAASGAPAACCSTRRAATAWRPTWWAATPRSSGARWATRWPAPSSPWSTTAPTPRSGAPTPSTTRATPPGATPSSRTASSPTTCGTSCGPARRAGSRRATAGARATSTCRWCA